MGKGNVNSLFLRPTTLSSRDRAKAQMFTGPCRYEHRYRSHIHPCRQHDYVIGEPWCFYERLGMIEEQSIPRESIFDVPSIGGEAVVGANGETSNFCFFTCSRTT